MEREKLNPRTLAAARAQMVGETKEAIDVLPQKPKTLKLPRKKATLNVCALAIDGAKVTPHLAPEHRGGSVKFRKSPLDDLKLSDAQAALVAEIVAAVRSDETVSVGLRTLLAAAVLAPSWRIGAVAQALQLAGERELARELRHAVNAMRSARFLEAAATSLDVMKKGAIAGGVADSEGISK